MPEVEGIGWETVEEVGQTEEEIVADVKVGRGSTVDKSAVVARRVSLTPAEPVSVDACELK